MNEYTPTTDEISSDYAHMVAPHTTWGEDGFDRWLDRERAAARREGQAEAWEKCANVIGDGLGVSDAIAHNPYRNGEGQ